MKKLNLLFIVLLVSTISSVIGAEEKIYEGQELFDLWLPKGMATKANYDDLGCRSIVDATPNDQDVKDLPYARVKVTIDKKGKLKKPELLETGNGATTEDMAFWMEFNKLSAFHEHFKTADGKKKGKKVKAIITLYFQESDSCK